MKPECLNWCYIFNKPNKMSVICKCLKKINSSLAILK